MPGKSCNASRNGKHDPVRSGRKYTDTLVIRGRQVIVDCYNLVCAACGEKCGREETPRR